MRKNIKDTKAYPRKRYSLPNRSIMSEATLDKNEKLKRKNYPVTTDIRKKSITINQ